MLSKNLSLAEVIKSTTARRLGIDNTPDEWTTENLKQVAINVFQPLRDAFKCPIYVSSGHLVAEWFPERLFYAYTKSLNFLKGS